MKFSRMVRIGFMLYFNKGIEFGILKDMNDEEMSWKYVGVSKGS